jgi:hypothetical protein
MLIMYLFHCWNGVYNETLSNQTSSISEHLFNFNYEKQNYYKLTEIVCE